MGPTKKCCSPVESGRWKDKRVCSKGGAGSQGSELLTPQKWEGLYHIRARWVVTKAFLGDWHRRSFGLTLGCYITLCLAHALT